MMFMETDTASAISTAAAKVSSAFPPTGPSIRSGLPLEHRAAVNGFVKSWTAAGPTNSQVLAFAASLHQPIGALFEGDRLLDQIAWASLGYYRPGDKFRLDNDWLMRIYDNPASLKLMLESWSARQQRTWIIAADSSALLRRDPALVQREATFWWERLKAARAAGQEALPPAGKPMTVLPESAATQPRQTSSPVFWGALAAFVAAGMGVAVLISRRR